jgi:hypothetical protein
MLFVRLLDDSAASGPTKHAGRIDYNHVAHDEKEAALLLATTSNPGLLERIPWSLCLQEPWRRCRREYPEHPAGDLAYV